MKYLVGDLCYIKSIGQYWDLICAYEADGKVRELPDGRKYAMSRTKHGDGSYVANGLSRVEFDVDSGTIGFIEKTENDLSDYFSIIEIEADNLSLEYEDGLIIFMDGEKQLFYIDTN